MFYEPSVRSGWRFELPPAAWPAAWTASAGEAVVSISAERSRGAQISWPGLMPAEPVEARLVGADGLELVRITIAAAERKIRLRVSTGQVLAVPEFSIQEAPDGSAPADLAWRSLVRSRWSDAHWATGREGGILRVLCNPEAGAEFAVRSGTLGLVDAVSGWALGVELRLE
jgi:hypothetical protein